MATALTRERIVRTALALIDRDGLGALSMRALGRELGADPMAVYHWLPNKDALFDAIVEEVWEELVLPPAGGPWDRQLIDLAHAVRDVLHAHPNALPLVATRQNVGDAGLALLDRGVALLHGAGLDRTEALTALSVASAFLIGHALATVGTSPEGHDADADARLTVAIDRPEIRRRMPDLSAALDPSGATAPPEVGFELGLELLLAGLRARLG